MSAQSRISRRRIHWTQTPHGRLRLKQTKAARREKALAKFGSPTVVKRKLRQVARDMRIHDAQLVAPVATTPLEVAYANTLPLDDHDKDALKAILDNVWHGMTLEEKIAMLDPRDPSNPDGAI